MTSDLTLTEAKLAMRDLRLVQFSVAYNVREDAVAVTTGLLVGLVSLVGFGLAGFAIMESREACTCELVEEHNDHD